MATPRRPWSVLLGAATLVVGLGQGCAPEGRTVTAERAQAEARAVAVATALDEAVDAYHDEGELDALAEWVEANPSHPEVDVWREVVALRTYEALVVGDPWEASPHEDGEDVALAPLPEPRAADLVALVDRYPGTVGAETARALLVVDGLQRMSQPDFNRAVVGLLDGRSDWVQDDYGRSMLPNVDLEVFRRRHAETLRVGLGQRLAADGCVESMEYCTWYVDRYPDDPISEDLKTAMRDEWYRRGHPRWRGVRFATCAKRCAKNCRSEAEPLDDACYAPCFARCEAINAED